MDIDNDIKMKLGFHQIYTEGLHPDVRFPRERYLKVADEIKARGGESLIDFFSPAPADYDALVSIHDNDYVDRFLREELSMVERRRIGLRPWTSDIIDRTLVLTGGTLAATDFALETKGYAANMAGGTHHAYRDHGSGYCIVNDIAIAAMHAKGRYNVKRVAIIDLDVHQGDGTAAIFKECNWVFTLSIHGEKNFPFKKQSSNLDIALPNFTTDNAYLRSVDLGLEAVKEFKPDLLFFQGGVDPLEDDKLGKLSITRHGLAERNRLVFDYADAHNLPCVVLMGGGYADPIDPSVMSLADLFIEAAYRHKWRRKAKPRS